MIIRIVICISAFIWRNFLYFFILQYILQKKMNRNASFFPLSCSPNEMCRFFEDKQCTLDAFTPGFKGGKMRMPCDELVFVVSCSALWSLLGDNTVSPYLHKHITPAVKVFCQLVTFVLLGQDGLHLHHPGGYKHVVRLNIPEEKRRHNQSHSQI